MMQRKGILTQHSQSPAPSSSRPSPQPASNTPGRVSTSAIDFAKTPHAYPTNPTSNSEEYRSISPNIGNVQQNQPFQFHHGSPFPNQQMASTSQANYIHPTMLPFRGVMPQIPNPEEHVDEYRSVIDDLTVRNKKLKTKLKRLEKAGQQQTDSEKLLEVNMSGIPPHRKRDLEVMLRRFVRSLEQPEVPQTASLSTEPTNLQALSTVAKPSSSYTSTKFADSGYGSLTTSNYGHPPRATKRAAGAARINNGVEASKARNRSIQSYLHDIPEGLLPRQSPTTMTVDTQKRLIVSRLEQLFLGRRATTEGHQQPIQQQEVSQSAARDDRSAIEARGQRAAAEGRREAFIMSCDTDEQAEPLLDREDSYASDKPGQSKTPKGFEQPFAEQRPTRPLDLDPSRAQDPGENIEYLRHLGFVLADDTPTDQLATEGDWFYLNLVVNMAQLHTLNVTLDLVKEAITDYSSRFELSSDGRKMRWRTEPLPKLQPLEPVGELLNFSSTKSSSGGYSRKRVRSIRLGANSSLESLEPPMTRRPAVPGSFGRSHNAPPQSLQPEASEIAEDSEMYDDQSVPPFTGMEDPTSHESSAWASSGNIRTASGSELPLEDGPLIFYKSQRFFTDLTGDRARITEEPGFAPNAKSMRPLGLAARSYSSSDCFEDSSSASVQAAVSNASLDVNADAYSNRDCLGINGGIDGRRASAFEPLDPKPFEASGLGCIYPADNFATFVTHQVRTEDVSPPAKRRKLSRLQDLIDHPVKETNVMQQVATVKHQKLPASSLPPAMYAVSNDGTDDSEDEEEEQAESSYEYAETIAISSSNSSSASRSATSDAGSDNDGESSKVIPSDASENISEPGGAESSDAESEQSDPSEDARGRQIQQALHRSFGRAANNNNKQESPRSRERSPSVDLLASARRADPQTIQQREREYDAEIAERLAEEMPAGSSAATCGGQAWSGYNSPAPEPETMDVDESDDDDIDDKGMSASS